MSATGVMTLLQGAHWSFYVVVGAALALGLCQGYQHAIVTIS